MKNITNMVVNVVESSKEFPVVITNNDVPLIEEASYIIRTLEDLGYKVETFVEGKTYGIKVSK